ncbi:MAG TPA: VOC family protein, partial [Propionibacteriaceae bacterium]
MSSGDLLARATCLSLGRSARVATSGIGRGRRLLFQEVPERKSGKNRLHIDIHSEPEGLDELVTRLEKLGATRIREVDEGPAGRWW